MQLGFLTDGRVEDVAFATRHGFDCVELALFGDTVLFEHHRTFKWSLREHGIGLAAVSLFGQSYCHADGAEGGAKVRRGPEPGARRHPLGGVLRDTLPRGL